MVKITLTFGGFYMTIKFLSFTFLALSLLLQDSTCHADDNLDNRLASAVMGMDSEEVTGLLAQGANPNFKQSDRPLITWAAQSGALDIVNSLLNSKADINAVDGIGQTALMRAVDMGQTPVVKALLDAKADVNLKTEDGKTALIIAVSNVKPEIVKALVDAGADVNAMTADNQFPALIAAQDGSEESKEIIAILASGKANLNASNAAYTPLSYAIEQGNKDLVKALVTAGADPNAKTVGGQAPLILAMDNAEIFQMLLDAKANPNITNSSGETAFTAAIQAESLERTETLIKAGADVNLKDESGRFPLTIAKSFPNNEEMVKLLMENGAHE
jgi:ankyrin repeat protein